MRLLFGWPGRFLAYFIVHLPRSWQLALGDLLGRFWFDVLRIRRKVVVENIGIAFPDLSSSQRTDLGRLSMCQFGRTMVEYCQLPFLSGKDLDEKFVFVGLKHLDQALAEGRGVLLLTLHLGNGDMATAGLALRGYPIFMISKIFKTKWLNDLWFGVRERLGVRFIPPRNSSYAVLKAIKANAVVIFVLDQFTGPPIGVKTTFFGRETGSGAGLAMIAERSESPVVPAYTFRNLQGKTEVHFEPPIPFKREATREGTLSAMTQIYTDQLESYVRMYPSQWMWLHKRWKKFKY